MLLYTALIGPVCAHDFILLVGRIQWYAEVWRNKCWAGSKDPSNTWESQISDVVALFTTYTLEDGSIVRIDKQLASSVWELVWIHLRKHVDAALIQLVPMPTKKMNTRLVINFVVEYILLYLIYWYRMMFVLLDLQSVKMSVRYVTLIQFRCSTCC